MTSVFAFYHLQDGDKTTAPISNYILEISQNCLRYYTDKATTYVRKTVGTTLVSAAISVWLGDCIRASNQSWAPTSAVHPLLQ